MSLSSENASFVVNCLALVVSVIFLNSINLTFPGTVDRGVFCGDPKIIYPYKSEIISATGLIFLSIVSVILALIVINYFIAAIVHLSNDSLSQSFCNVFSVRKAVRVCWKENLFLWLVYSNGVSFCYILTTIAKISAGCYRPHFLSVCNPNGTAKASWAELHCAENTLMLRSDFNCTGDSILVDDALNSFPSGHASISFYCSVFGVLYLQKLLCTFSSASILKWFFQSLFMATGWVIAFSRVADNHHHIEDIAAGALLGSSLAYVSVEFCLSSQIFTPCHNNNNRRMNSEDSRAGLINKVVRNPSTGASNDSFKFDGNVQTKVTQLERRNCPSASAPAYPDLNVVENMRARPHLTSLPSGVGSGVPSRATRNARPCFETSA